MIRVAVFDDNKERREALAILLEAMDTTEYVGAEPNCTRVVEVVRDRKPEVVLMDIDMPQVDGIAGLKLIKENFPEVKVIMQTIFEEEDKILEAICSGADGYILKQKSPMQLLDGITDVMAGGAPMTSTIAKKVLKLFNNSPSVSAKANSPAIELTKRETEVLTLLVEGYSYKMIATKCFVSYSTVNKHVSNIYEKLQVHSVAAAVSKALKEGLV